VTARSAANNLSLGSTAAAFELLWHQAEISINASRGQQTSSGGVGPPLNATAALRLWKRLPSALSMGFLTARSCTDVNGCVGVQHESGKCVCYAVALRTANQVDE
jgi:hypothetical protein